MQERIKALRKALELSQGQFGERLGVKQNTVATWESGIRTPNESVIRSICREFGVNELWLRHGDEGGPMFKELSRKDAIAAYMGQLLGGQRTELEEKIIEFMGRTTVKEWNMLLDIMRPLAEEIAEIEKPPDA